MTFAALFDSAKQKQSDKAHDRAKRKERPPKQEEGTGAAEGAVKPEKKKKKDPNAEKLVVKWKRKGKTELSEVFVVGKEVDKLQCQLCGKPVS
jgi:hypothetical protein